MGMGLEIIILTCLAGTPASECRVSTAIDSQVVDAETLICPSAIAIGERAAAADPRNSAPAMQVMHKINCDPNRKWSRVGDDLPVLGEGGIVQRDATR